MYGEELVQLWREGLSERPPAMTAGTVLLHTLSYFVLLYVLSVSCMCLCCIATALLHRPPLLARPRAQVRHPGPRPHSPHRVLGRHHRAHRSAVGVAHQA